MTVKKLPLFQCPACGHKQNIDTSKRVIPCSVCNYDMMIEDVEGRSTDPKIELSKTLSIEGCPMPDSGGEMFWYDNIAGTTAEYPMNSLQCGRCFYELRDTSLDKAEAIIAHNELCEYVRVGKLAKAFCKNPPLRKRDWCDTKLTEQLGFAFNRGVRACLDRLQEKGAEDDRREDRALSEV